MPTRTVPRSFPRWIGVWLLLAGVLYPTGAWSREPILVVRAAGVDRLLDDIDYLIELAERPELAGVVRGVQAAVNDLRGIDKSRPVCLVAYAPTSGRPGKELDIALLVPVTDIVALQKTVGLTRRVKLVPGDAEGDYVLEAPKKSIPVRVEDGWAIVSEQAELLEEPSVRRAGAEGAELSSDVHVRIHWSNLPPAIQNEAVRQMERDRDRERARRTSEDDVEFAVRQVTLDILLTTGRGLLRDLDAIELTFDLDHEARQIRSDALFSPRNDSALAREFAALPAPSQFNEPVRRSEAAVLSFAATTPRFVLRGMEDLFVTLDAQVEESAHDEVEREIVRKVADVVKDMLTGDRVDGFLAIVPSLDHRISVVAGLRSGRTAEAAELLRTVLPEAARGNEVTAIEMQALEVDGVTFHRIEPAQSRTEDEEVFGQPLSVFVGTGREAIWAGMGSAPLPDILKSTLQTSNAASTTPDPAPLLAVIVHLQPWAALFEDRGDAPLPVRQAIARAVLESTADELSLKLHATQAGLKLTLRADDVLLKALFAAAAAENAN